MVFFVIDSFLRLVFVFVSCMEAVVAVICVDESSQSVGEAMVDAGVEIHEMVAKGDFLIFVAAVDDRYYRDGDQVIP